MFSEKVGENAMIQHELTKEDIFHMAESFVSILHAHSETDQELVKKSLQLYRQGTIYNTKIDNDKLSATVFDGRAINVELDLYFVQISQCSVHKHTICEHTLAAFLYVYSSFAPVGDFIDAFNGKTKAQKPSVASLPTTTVVTLHSIENWIEQFNKKYATFLEKIERTYPFFSTQMKQRLVVERTLTEYYKMLLTDQPRESRLGRLYKLHAGVTAIMKVSEFTIEHHVEQELAIPACQQLIHELEDVLYSLRGDSFSEKQRTLVEESIGRFDTLLHVSGELQYFSMLLYRMIWSTLLHEKDWIVAQDKKLLKQFQTFSGSSHNQVEGAHRHSLHVALVHFAFLLDSDDVAFSRADSLPAGDFGTFFYIAELASEKKQFKRMERWLDYAKHRFVPILKEEGFYHAKRQLSDSFISLYIAHADAIQSDESFVKALQDMLPYSFYTYNDYLLTEENYKEWAELQLLVGFQPETHGQQLLRKIEKTDRSLLLPLYHQAAQHAIAEKNRTAYKLAVRRLKKLRTHYRQLKKVDQWETYITFLATKHRRLRAFQEELRKGKLIHD